MILTFNEEANIGRNDRAPISPWFSLQARYVSLEASHLPSSDRSRLGRVDRLHLTEPGVGGSRVVPPLMQATEIFVRGQMSEHA